MKLNAFKIIACYMLFWIIWFLLNTGFGIFLEDQLSAEAKVPWVLIKTLCFVLINCIIIIKLVKLNNKIIAQKEEDALRLYHANPNPFWIYEPETLKFLTVNEAAIKAYGYSREEFLSMTIKDIRKQEDHEKIVNYVKSVKKEQNVSSVWQHLKKDGSLIYVNITSEKIRYQKKECAIVFATDTTERIEYEQELKLINQRLNEEKQKLQETEKLAKVSGWEYYVEDGTLIWADELYRIFDIEREGEKVDYSLILKAIHFEDLQLYNEAIENILKHGKDLDTGFRFVTKTGSIKYVKVLGKMLYLGQKKYKVQGTMQDVTELRLMQLEKNNYQQRLTSTLNNITDGYFMLNRNWVFTAVNTNAEKMLGFKQHDILNHRYLDLFPDTSNMQFYNHFKKVLENGIPVNFEALSTYTKKWFCINVYPTDEGAAVFFSDITQAKEKDLQLKEAFERYDLIAKATKDVIYDHDAVNNKIVYSNSIADLLNISLDDIGSNINWWKSRIHTDDLARVIAKYKFAIHNKKENCGLEYRMRTSDNQYKYVYDQGYLQYDANGKFIRMIGAIKDIDQLKRFDDENKRLAEIITKVNNMIVIQDATNGITWVNKAFENFTGYTLCEVKGKLPHHVLSGPETDLKTTQSILAAKKSLKQCSYEIINYTQEKCKYWVNIEFTPLFTADGKPDGYICIHTDITARKEKEEQISRQNEILRNIAWMGSHELRRPVASILGLIELITETEDETEKSESILMMKTCTKHLDEIIRKINNRIEQEISEEQEATNVKVVL
ncbi:PAS domain-containing protein [Mucilaginibacter arboris]|uniref:histidine kinase n=1 Tax=Mucilaginibacter arboris TaxID=2682090 RepID=A0A7K1SYP1_9SPHI|nr:PAS domain S-box protein [Mucilaginibacter arboris]MVN22150.1 PAS domain S-box protein [Mucilaginibacter arboris]